MTWYAWILVGLYVFNSGATFAKVGQPRKPTTVAEAWLVFVFAGLMIWAIVALAAH